MIKVGIAGCGAIGSYLAGEILKRYKKAVSLEGVCDTDEEKIKELRSSLKKKIQAYPLADLVKRCDLIIESATAKAAQGVVALALKHRTDVMVMSVGGLLLNPGLIRQAEKKGIRIYVPSGAICGLDGLKAAKMGKIYSVKLTTTKPVKGLAGAEYVKKNKINLENIDGEKVVFRGTALDAVAGFPKNINVAAVLSLAGIGAAKTEVCIVASALAKRNIHSIEIRGDFGKIISCSENVPSKVNPKTSTLAMFSALATLDDIVHNISIGT